MVQRYTDAMNLLRVTLLGLACAALPAVALSQWQWVDKEGRKVFSDRSPPADIPLKNIVRQPGSRSAAVEAPEPAATASQPAGLAVSTPRLSGKEKALEDKKKAAQDADAEKKKAQEEELAKLRADNCVRAKRSKASFDSGIRISRMNDKGEREFLDDATRASEAKRLESIIAKDCQPAGG